MKRILSSIVVAGFLFSNTTSSANAVSFNPMLPGIIGSHCAALKKALDDADANLRACIIRCRGTLAPGTTPERVNAVCGVSVPGIPIQFPTDRSVNACKAEIDAYDRAQLAYSRCNTRTRSDISTDLGLH